MNGLLLLLSVVKFSRNGVPPPVSGVPPPKVVPPPGNDVPSPFGKKSLKLLPPEVRFQGLNAPNTISAGAPLQTPLGRLQSSPRTTSWKGGGLLIGGREGKGETIEEGKGRKKMGRNVAFHHILLINLTTG